MYGKPNREHLCVCKHCLCGIEAHEGKQATTTVWVDEEDPDESRCDWCKESGFDTLYEII